MAPTDERASLSDTEAVRIAQQLEQTTDEQAAVRTLAELSPEDAGEVLRHMDDERSAQLLASLRQGRAATILGEMAPDSAVDLMEDLGDAEQTELFERMETGDADTLRQLIAYEPDSAGGLMSPEVAALPVQLTVEEAIATLRRKVEEAEMIYYAYVVDDRHRLLGVLTMRDLIVNDPDTPIHEIMIEDVLTVPPTMDAEEVAHLFNRYNFLALPVVDESQRLLGIVTVDDVIASIREEETEDMQRLVGIAAEDRVFDPWHQSLRRRQPWLLINLVTAFAAAFVVQVFEGTIAQITALAVLMPVIAGQGGNAGSQTVTVVVRGMALGELSAGYGRRVLVKELVLGALNGLIIGVLVAIVASFWQGDAALGLVVAASMVLTLVTAGVAGAVVPLGLRMVGADPALASTVVLTTVTDVFGFLYLLGLATLLLL
ncbi:MAG: magnesium transporter [Candidatus Bipolaricaulia bacterium]